jgi:glucan phosphoethanolaminetransferase (alkaline phosphatase superfamily)
MRITLRKEQVPILLVNLFILAYFMVIFALKANYEFIIYVGVIAFFFLVILLTNNRVHYPTIVLWGLTLWAFMHMAGGGIFVNGQRMYEMMILNIAPAYEFFRYDQLVHLIGFGVATLFSYYLVKPLLNIKIAKKRWFVLSIVVVMAGLGIGAFNEIVEFIVSIVTDNSGVGGYVNTSMDLVMDLIGGIIAMIIIKKKEL